MITLILNMNEYPYLCLSSIGAQSMLRCVHFALKLVGICSHFEGYAEKAEELCA